jgi:DNA-nicking Smr family endonuclease
MDSPFSDLIRIKSSLPKAPRGKGPEKKSPKGAGPAAPPAGPEGGQPGLEGGGQPQLRGESEEFLSAMGGVTPLKTPARRVVPAPPGPEEFRALSESEDLEVIRSLNELVSGQAGFDISFTGEFMAGHVRGIPEKVTQALKNGELPIEDRVDLHGHTLETARGAVHKFISTSSALGLKMVLIIHGRGLRSPDGVPVLKANLEDLLVKSSIRKYILAFSSARPCDGGTGACYVLLRTRFRKRGGSRGNKG